MIGSVGYGCLSLKSVISSCNQVDLVEGFGFAGLECLELGRVNAAAGSS